MGSVSDPDLEGVDVKLWNGAHNGGITEGSTPTTRLAPVRRFRPIRPGQSAVAS